ncbi:hypothetical protein C8J57DRAFT_1377121 [Mycena rebaudengoi]|nr:hypothetical protein C8J57DRAFT_1377121 [Mycena rebaudengoi]
MVTLLLLIIRLSLCCVAFSWQKNVPRNQNTQLESPTVASVDDELNDLLLGQAAALDNYSRRPDCFRRVAAKIRLRCGELELNEDERVKAAISMTLCELATATHHSLPLECADFTVDSKSSSIRIHGECVDALSRSAQFWSSYSGYLRDVPQLCFAFQRWNDIDTAKDIYKNSTLETMALIRFLLARERADVANTKRRDDQLLELQNIIIRFSSMSEALDITSRDLAPHFKQKLNSIFNEFKSEMTGFQSKSRDVHSQLMEKLESEATLILQMHAHSLNSLVPAVQDFMVQQLDSALSPFQTQSLHASSLANSAQEAWTHLLIQFNSMQQSILELSESADRTAIILNSTTRQAQLVHDAQLSASSSASNLAETINHLTTTTHAELEKINATADLLKQSLLPSRQSTGLLTLMEVVLHMSPTTVSYLRHLPLFHVLSGIYALLLYLLRSSFSALMSIALLFFSSRKYLIKEPLPLAPQSTVAPQPQRDLELNSRFGIRKSRIPDRLCNRL